jgi:hypothetical protein
MAVSFFYRVEFYPLTAWQLYSVLNTSGKITYYKVLGHQASGAIVQVRFEDAVGALGWDGRYTRELKQCFGGVGWSNFVSKDVDICKKFLTASGFVYNEKASPNRKMTHFEIQERVWDFRANPSDPEHGKVINSIIVAIEPAHPR